MIENTKEARVLFEEERGCTYGRAEITINEKTIEDLRKGRVLPINVNDEYSVFIELETETSE